MYELYFKLNDLRKLIKLPGVRVMAYCDTDKVLHVLINAFDNCDFKNYIPFRVDITFDDDNIPTPKWIADAYWNYLDCEKSNEY